MPVKLPLIKGALQIGAVLIFLLVAAVAIDNWLHQRPHCDQRHFQSTHKNPQTGKVSMCFVNLNSEFGWYEFNPLTGRWVRE